MPCSRFPIVAALIASWLAGEARFGQRAFGETVYLTPSADTSLLENFPDHNFGGQTYFNSGTTQNYTKNRGLLRFDLPGQVPTGATINSVTLTLEVVGQPSEPGTPSNFGLHRMLVGWGEGDKSGQPPQLGASATTGEANWTDRFAFQSEWGVSGGQAGVDFNTLPSGESYVYGVNFSPYLFDTTPDLVGDLQSWLDHPESNFGWMLLSQSEDQNFTARRFASREDPFSPPQLAIDFTPVPEPSVWALGLAACATVWLFRGQRGR